MSRITLALTASALAAVLLGGASVHAASRDVVQIAAPADITVEATDPCGQTYCATVSYSFSATGGTPPYTFICNLPSGSQFTVGSHTVSCIARDAHGNSSPPASFTVTVTGGGSPPPPPPPPPPLQISPPGDITVAATDPCGQTFCAVVNYSYTVTGGSPPYNLVCNLPSGSQFTVGSHTVSCIAQDSRGNSTPPASFSVTVTGGEAPSAPPPPQSASSGQTGGETSGSTSGGTNSSSSATSSGSSGSSGSTGTSPAGSVNTQATDSLLATASLSNAAIKPTKHGRRLLSFVVKTPNAASLHATLTSGSGHVVLRVSLNVTHGNTHITRTLPAHVRAGTRLTLKVTLETGGQKRAFARSLIA